MGHRLTTILTVVVAIAWVLALTPFAHAVVAPNRFPEITGLLTALLGLPAGLQALQRK